MQPAYGHQRTLRLFGAAIALLVLLALVALASRSGFGHTTPSQTTPSYVSWAMSIFLVLFVVMIPVAAWAYSVQMREFKLQNRQQRSMQSRIVRSLGILAIVLLILFARQWAHRNGLLPTIPTPWGQNGKGRRGLAGPAANRYQPAFEWPVLWVSLALALAAAAFVWWRWRKRADLAPFELAAEPTIEADVAASIADAIEDLEAEPDARRAVIAAYARMEKALARHGLRRDPSETPVEYLRRILLGLTSRRDAVTNLTSLFERAKFSAHDVDSSMKQDAIAALRSIRDDLQEAPA